MSISQKSVFAALPRTERGVPLVLGSDPKGKNFLYTHGHSVYIRDIKDPSVADIYTQHAHDVKVAKYSPSGFYIASADTTGKVRIWDTINAEHVLAHEYQPISGEVRDLSWSPDSERMVVVGAGQKKTHAFLVKTGTSVGEITGHRKAVNSCDWRPCRPFRVITGGEDMTSGVFSGPPFKVGKFFSDHSAFVQSVRFSPNGKLYATGGFDGRIFIYDGDTSEKVGELMSCDVSAKKAHGGGVYGLSWSGDSTRLLSASGDRSCRIFDVERLEESTRFVLGSAVDQQQVGCLWQNEWLLSVSVDGTISYLDPNSADRGPARQLFGHNTSITALATLPRTSGDDPDAQTSVITCSYDGRLTSWQVPVGHSQRVTESGHGCMVNGAAVMCADGPDSARLLTIGFDNHVRALDPGTLQYTAALKLTQQPQAVAACHDLAVVATENQLLLLSADASQVQHELSPLQYRPLSAACCSQAGEVAVGSEDTCTVTVYSVHNQQLQEKSVQLPPHRGSVTDLAYSPDGRFLAACDSMRQVIVYTLPDYSVMETGPWASHTARVCTIAWSPDSQCIASGGLDTNIYVWNVTNPRTRVAQMHAHGQSKVSRVVWLDNERVLSVGDDCNTRTFNVTR